MLPLMSYKSLSEVYTLNKRSFVVIFLFTFLLIHLKRNRVKILESFLPAVYLQKCFDLHIVLLFIHFFAHFLRTYSMSFANDDCIKCAKH